MDALTGERVDEAGGVADEQPSRAGDVARPGGRSAPRRGSALGARSRARRRGDGREPRDGRLEALGRRAAPSSGSAMPTFSSPSGRRRQPDVVAVADVHLAVIGEAVDART